MARTFPRLLTSLAATAGLGLLAPGVAGAAQPVVQACVGTTFSDAAHSLPPSGVGTTVSGFAQAPDGTPGLGDGIHLLQAGLVPDSTVPNTCNG